MTDRTIGDPASLAHNPCDDPNPVHNLLYRMRSGDRDAAAQFLQRFGQRIRRRVQGRLRPYIRRLFDSQEIISTVARRLDLLVLGGKLAATTEAQLWALVFTIAENAVIDKKRVFDRMCALESSVTVATSTNRPSQAFPPRHASSTSAQLDRAFSALHDRIDREILSLWLQDTPHLITARLVGLTPAAVRKRWEAIKRRLQPILSRE